MYEIDNFNGLDKAEGEPFEYKRIEVEVINEQKKVRAWTYIANSDKFCNDCIPEKEYIKHLLQGKEYLTETYLNEIKSVKTKNERTQKTFYNN